jgi:hypothetical protein
MHMPRRLLAVSLVVLCTAALSSTAFAATISVDVDTTISAGKTITGTGQNLPSLAAATPWDIGPYPASQVKAYYTSGQATRDQAAVSRSALRWTSAWVRKTCGSDKPARIRACKAAAVFDVDDTLLSSYEVLSTMPQPFTYDSAVDRSAEENCTTPAIQPVVDLFTSLKRMGVTPFLITGRPESARAITEACLTDRGITGYRALILKPAGNTQSATERKAEQREALINQGWKIGPSIGDQLSDMSLGQLEHGFLLPNGMYYLP